jgi:hypothetical protein
MRIKHYTFFTESHKILLKYFLNTFPFDADIDLVIRYMPQECNTGVYVSQGWNKTMQKKVNYIIDAFDELKEGDLLIHTDVDVIFFKPYKETIIQELGESDIIFQSDRNTACMGFFACKINGKTKNLFLKLNQILKYHEQDQAALNYLLFAEKFDINFKLFSQKIFNYGFVCDGLYKNESFVPFPEDMVALHANYTIGIETKINLIKLALRK